MIKDSKHVKINSVNPFCLIISKANGYLEKINKKKYLPLVLTNERKKRIKTYAERCSKIKDWIRSITKNSDHFDKSYMKIKFNSDNDLPLNKTI